LTKGETTVIAPARTTSDRQSAQLDRRRDQASAAATAAEKAKAGVTELDNRLQTNATMTKQQAQALRNAVAEVKRLKRALKTGAKERDRLSRARKRAVTRADRAQTKSRAAESRYDRSVLADMVRREKAKDRADSARPPVESTALAPVPVPDRSPMPATTATKTAPATKTAAATRTAPPRTAATARTAAGSPARTGGTAVADPPPERPDPGTETATRTAARKTAAGARARTPRRS
jgi:hypothetical protein